MEPTSAMTLVIKGDPTVAQTACVARGIKPASILWHARFNECVVVVYEPVSWSLFAEWFCDGTAEGAPFPSATLLWYGPRHG